MKVATTTLALLLFLRATTPVILAQSAPSAAALAGEEAVRRQANVIELRRILAQAAKARQAGQLTNAAERYEAAYSLVQNLGTGIDIQQERQETVTGLTTVRVELARRAEKRGDLVEADTQLKRVLRVDPNHAAAQQLKVGVDKALLARQGKIPSKEVLERISEFNQERVKTSTLVRDGKLLMEMGKLDEAEERLNQATREDPENAAAFYYLSLIQERRFQQQARIRENTAKADMVTVQKTWNPPNKRDRLPTPNPFTYTNQVNTSVPRQRIYKKLADIMLDEVSYDGLPLSEVIRDLNDESRKRDPDKIGVNFIIFPYADVPAQPAQAASVDALGNPLPAAPPRGPIVIEDTIIKIAPPLRKVRLLDVLDAVTKAGDRPLKFSVEDYAVVFTQRGVESPQLYTREFRVDPNTFVQGLESVSGITFGTSGGGGGGGFGGGGGGFGGGGGGFGGGGGGFGGGGGSGGGSFIVPQVSVTGISQLGGGGGLGGGGFGGGGGGLGGGGLGGGGLGGGGNGGGGLTAVTVTNAMQNASQMVRDFFTVAGLDFSTNSFSVDASGNPVPSGKAIFFNDRTGVILARATLEELDIIEKAIHALNYAPPEINIETRFTEISQNDSKALGFDWFLGNILMNHGSIGLQGGTAPSFAGSPRAANPLGTFPGVPPGTDLQNPTGTTLPATGSDTLLTPGLRNVVGKQQGNVPAVATVTGILTDPQFRLVIHALEQRDGVDVLSAPNVTTLSGRQAQIQAVELKTIVTSQNFNQTASGGFGGTTATGVGGFAGGGGAVAAASQFPTSQIPLGPTLDIVPYVSADGYSIQMTIIPTITEFLGYDDPGQFIPQAQSAAGNTLGTPLVARLPLPKFRVRQLVTSAIVWDGQTIVLGGLIAEDVSKFKDKIPVLGDIPFLGRLFRSESMSTTKKNLLVFVTPTIIDPAGNRVHTDDNLPYDPKASGLGVPPSSP